MAATGRTEAMRYTVAGVFVALVRDPKTHLLKRWNWKSALTGSILRAALFFFVNLRKGLSAAEAALVTEIFFRLATTGFYGAMIQAFRKAEPKWAATVTVMFVIPALSHGLEFVVHSLRGTADLKNSILASITMTVVSTLFNLYIMRRGALLVDDGKRPFWEDMRRMPGLIAGFVAFIPLTIYRSLRAR